MKLIPKTSLFLSGLILSANVFFPAARVLAQSNNSQPETACVAIPAKQNETAGDEYKRRMQIIDALETTKNDACLAKLVQADVYLHSYSVVLKRVSTYLQDPTLVEKLLTLPVLNTKAPEYKRAVAGVFFTVAANGKTMDQKIATLLFDRFKDDQGEKDNSLRFIFETATMNMPSLPNVEMTRLLIEAGANAEHAFTTVREHILQDQKPDKEYRLNKLDKFRAALSAPG